MNMSDSLRWAILMYLGEGGQGASISMDFLLTEDGSFLTTEKDERIVLDGQ